MTVFLYKRLILIISLFAITLIVFFSNLYLQKEHDSKLIVYTTVYPLQYFTERIGGNYVDVKSVYRDGAENHNFYPTQKEMIAIAESDLLFYIGLDFEDFIKDAEKNLITKNVRMVATSEAITEEMFAGEHLDEGHIHDDSNIDPTVWMSPILSDALAYSIKDALIDLAPDKKADFEKNFEELRNDLLKLDRQFIDMATNKPIKTFFISHDSFGYIAETYGLEQVVIAGTNAQDEHAQKNFSSLVEKTKSQDVKYVLFEQDISSKLAEAVKKELGAESLKIHNLKTLTVEDENNGDDYFSLMNYNIQILEKALSGK